MSVAREIVATYRGPGRVVRRLLASGGHEGRALAILMAACLIIFVAQWPRLAREAHLAERELNPLLGGALLGWLFIAPLFFYALALVAHLVSRAFGGEGSGYAARLALFWALLASTPLILLHGLVAGFIGPGPGLVIVGVLWCAVFLWFWIAGMRAAEWGRVAS
ncbi:YIP1 family protein [Roseovarius sp. SCSIO 43702]|uniref:YIP1 family protein n=1 Tax=Roseovarius sp. SCSIO 43702 TaxID=2823043 RepID=UPI001C7388AD|nr:YIP1 family protein [Roseovarius sp. SCSIO 43702]QYX55448.1 YIP1 family protein [Roseovarius sp. SCSIO 43702]